MSIIKMRGPIDVLFAFKIFSLPVPVPELFGKYLTRPVPKSKTPTRRTLIAGTLLLYPSSKTKI